MDAHGQLGHGVEGEVVVAQVLRLGFGEGPRAGVGLRARALGGLRLYGKINK